MGALVKFYGIRPWELDKFSHYELEQLVDFMTD